MKKLRTKMIAVVFLASAVIFAITFLLVRGALITYQRQQADAMTLIITNYNGEVPLMQEYEESYETGDMPQYAITFSEESAFRTRYFVVTLDTDGSMLSVSLDHVASVDEDLAGEMAQSVIGTKETAGYYGIYRYRIAENENGTTTVIFLDCEENFAFRKATITIMGMLSVCFPILITLIFGIFSKRVMEPFEENARRQKQFITDASHELKTPLAIISANAEVLEYKVGENDWTRNITGQTAHMGELIDDLLTLAKMDEYDGNLDMEQVQLTELVRNTVENFAEVFRQKQVSVEMDLVPDVRLYGNAKQLAMLVSILAENASKYVTEGGSVRISLKTTAKYAVFSIYNTADLDPNLDLRKLFGRFYRPDSSRTSGTGGQGIGLSTAKKIVELHAGSISARRAGGGISFEAQLSLKLKRSIAKQA